MPTRPAAGRLPSAAAPAKTGPRFRTAADLSNCASEALAELEEAASIYEQYRNHHGLGSVHLNYGYLHLDNGDLEHAEAEAKTAYRLGEEKRDHILMARARLLDCMIENARVEEEIGESAEPGGHARQAQDCAQEAIELARHTQNRRLLADSYIWQGLTFCNRFFDDPDSARHSYDQAITLSKGDHADGTWEDLETLKTRVLRAGRVNPVLRAWSQGSLGDKTFPANHRGVRRTDYSEGVGTGRAQGFSGGDPLVDVAEENPQDSQSRTAPKVTPNAGRAR